MDKRAVINKKTVFLNDNEIKNASDFHKKRVAFALRDKDFVFNNDPQDDRDHQHWLCEDYGMSIDEFEHVIRGYMRPGVITIYVSNSFDCVDPFHFSIGNLKQLLDEYKNVFDTETVTINNGVMVKTVGEIWPPKEELMKIVL